ncbi:MAG: cytochrome-c peroxidase [Acidobacteriota bacterium]
MSSSPRATLVLCLACLLSPVLAPGSHAQDFGPVMDADFRNDGAEDPLVVELGRFLFFDKELSGNRNISCATCHHPLAATGDGLSLPVGEGGEGLGVTRSLGRGGSRVQERVPRNAPPLFNMGAREFRVMFHDGRVRVDRSRPSGFATPAGDDLPEGLDSVLAAQAMFPVTSAAEMAGESHENPIAAAAARGRLAGPRGVWERLAERLRAIPEYVDLFMAAFPHIHRREDITYVDAANAIAAFEEAAWRSDDSPFDRFLRGDKGAMSRRAKRGMRIFYGEAGCSFCHAGPFQTDMDFHAIAMPQIGPGKGDGPDGHDDFGLERVTGRQADRFKFRTPSLRNVAITGPWGHAGAYDTLEAVVRHHLDPVESLSNYDQSQAVLPSRPNLDRLDFVVMNDPDRVAAIADANERRVTPLSDRQVAALIEFLQSLTDPAMLDLRDDVPKRVPSELPVFDQPGVEGS